jgi:predicted ATPase
MIKKIEVENFKSLKQISFDAKKLNLLAGVNGMGKSSFVQALLLLKQSKSLIDNGKLMLKGELTDIGKGKDLLYQFASDETIKVSLETADNKEFIWNFKYEPDSDVLKSSTPKTAIKTEDFVLFKDFQYISADRLGPQSIYDTSTTAINEKNLGIRGEFTAHFLHEYGNKLKVDEHFKHQSTNDLSLIHQVNGWLGEVSPGVKLNIVEVPHIDKLLLNYQFELGVGRTASFKPANVGFGLSYVLPIIVSLLTAQKNKIIIIENPESHIHPKGQAELGRLMAFAAEFGAQLFIETHSDHIINGVRVSVKDGLIKKDNVKIPFFHKITDKDEQYTKVDDLIIDEQGEINEYPEHFLDEWNNQLLKLI